MINRRHLVTAAQARDADAFMCLVELETPSMFRLCQAILRDPHDAEDALQDAFGRAWRELPRLRDEDRWAAWFRRIVVSSSIDTIRRRRSHRVVSLGFHEPPPIADASEGVASRDAVERAMDRLDARDRALIALRFGNDLELPAVAVALGIPLGTAKSRLHRVLARLRSELENDDDFRRDRETASGAAANQAGAGTTEPGL